MIYWVFRGIASVGDLLSADVLKEITVAIFRIPYESPALNGDSPVG